jgi:hypothetical protein
MHVGLTSPLCPLARPESWEPCPSKEVPHCPQTQTSNVLRAHKKGSQINMPEYHQGFTLMQTQGLRFPPQPRYLSKSLKKKLPPPHPPVGLLHREGCSITRALSTGLSKSPETTVCSIDFIWNLINCTWKFVYDIGYICTCLSHAALIRRKRTLLRSTPGTECHLWKVY